MRRSILTLVLCTLCLCPLFSQEAFYIYRNDGDFNGFFFDEVVEMRYSKLALDSVEYEQYVTYEVELADTIYRIPLAAIDSIGFQQPEIKLNPKVRLIQNAGLSPYLKDVDKYGQPEELVALFEDLPMALVPQVGDVLIGVGTDDCGEIYEKLGGSFSLVVQRVASNGNRISVYGRQVEAVGEVFEQFISVEQIGIDEAGQMRRRIAGCDENGLPRRVMQVEGDHYADLINFNGNISKEWSIPGDSSKVVLNAALNFQVFMRAQYNITLLGGVYVKITNEFRTRIKPSLAISLNGELRANSDNPYSIYLSEVLFPVSCPVFAIKPWPSYFMHLSGSIDAKLNFPQIYMGLGIEYTINSNKLFPLGVNIYWAPDDGSMPDDELLSAEFSISGSIHQGVEFEGMINTASWFKKVLQVAAGVHFYVGPKMTATVAFKHDFFKDNNHNSLYSLLSAGRIDLSLISILMEITAKAQMGWYDPQEKTFFSGTKDYLEHQIRLLPVFEQTEVEFTKKNAIVKLKPMSGTNFKFTTYYLGIYAAANGLDDEDGIAPKEIMQGNRWIERETDEEVDHSTTIPLQRLGIGRYYAVPVIEGDSLNFIAQRAAQELVVPLITDFPSKAMHFNANGDEATLRFTTNCPPQGITFEGEFFKTHQLDTIDRAAGVYEIKCTTEPNRSLFMEPSILEEWDFMDLFAFENKPKLSLLAAGSDYGFEEEYFIGFTQDRSSLSNVSVDISGDAYFTLGNRESKKYAGYSGPVTCTRQGDSIILITGTNTEINEFDASNKTIRTINMTLTRNEEFGGFTLSGSMTQKELYGNTQGTACTFNFASEPGYTFSDAYDGNITFNNAGSITIHSSSYVEGGETWNQSSEGGVRGSITVKAPGEQ